MGNRQTFRERRRSYSERRVDTREPRERFLIVCEGEKTEPLYFKAFRVPKNVINVVGLGDNTVRIVQEAIHLMEEDTYDQVWCVFDRNSFPAQNFNAAIELATRNDINVAYSNECFELWYLLHFHFYNTAISRKDYIDRLATLLGRSYEKNSKTIYDQLLERQPDAIRNAQQLIGLYDPPRPERDNPSTTVHLLVEQLNKFVQ
jgi:RloB-like protein